MTTTHFDQLQLAKPWGASSAPDQSTSGCLARSSTACVTLKPTKTSVSRHRLPSSATTRSCQSSQWPPHVADKLYS